MEGYVPSFLLCLSQALVAGNPIPYLNAVAWLEINIYLSNLSHMKTRIILLVLLLSIQLATSASFRHLKARSHNQEDDSKKSSEKNVGEDRNEGAADKAKEDKSARNRSFWDLSDADEDGKSSSSRSSSSSRDGSRDEDDNQDGILNFFRRLRSSGPAVSIFGPPAPVPPTPQPIDPKTDFEEDREGGKAFGEE